MTTTPLHPHVWSTALGAILGMSIVFCLAMTPQTAVAAPALLGPPRPQGQAVCGASDSRTPISALPFTVDQPGSYYLTASLKGSPGQDGILIASDNVTLDLNGFCLDGGSGSLRGISFDAGDFRQNISVFGGSVVNWGEDGIGGASFVATYSTFRDLRLLGNGSEGLFAGVGCIVQDCISKGNGGQGIITSGEGTVVNCISSENGSGFFVNDAGVVRGCVALSNAQWGLSLPGGTLGVQRCVVSECVAAENGAEGIGVADGSVIVHSVSFDNVLDGIRTRESVVIGCASSQNGDNCDDDGIDSLVLDSLNCP